MSRKDELINEINECRAKLRDNTRAIDPASRQILLDTIKTDKIELSKIDSEEREPKMKIVAVNAPTGRSVVYRTNTNQRKVFNGNGTIRMGSR